MNESAKRASLIGAVLMTASLLTILTAGIGERADPAAAAVDFRVLVQRHFDLINSVDVAGIVATFSDDAVLVGPGPCERSCVGKAAIRTEIERRAGNAVHHKIISLTETSGRGNGRLELSANLFRACGAERVIAPFQVELQNDLISYFASSFDVSDPQTAAFLACMAAGGPLARPAVPPAPTVRPPSTGDGGLLP